MDLIVGDEVRMWLSYVIPLYNCEPYVAVCLDSILAQGLAEKEYEVVVVNDGSTDRGAAVVERYCREHPNFRLINKANGGVSSARNRGMDEARGEYIYFMDPDDRLLPGGMRALRDAYLGDLGSRPDMVTFDYRMVYGKYDAAKWERIQPHRETFRGTFGEYVRRSCQVTRMCWQNLLLKDFLDKCNLRFQPYEMAQDLKFMIDVLAIADATIVATDLNIYRYIVRPGSSVTSVDLAHVRRAFYGFMDIYKSVKAASIYDVYPKEYYNDFFISHLQCSGFIRVLSAPFPYSSLKNMFHDALHDGFYPIQGRSSTLLRAINILVHYPLMVRLLSVPYRHVYLPFLRSRVRGGN